MKTKIVPILIIIVISFLIAVAVYNRNTPNSETQKTTEAGAETAAVSKSLTESSGTTASGDTSTSSITSTPTTTTIDTANTSSATSSDDTANTSTTTASGETTANSSTTETSLGTSAPTTEEIDKNLPTLRLIVTEGPVIIPGSGMCYYRVEARVSGIPAPFIKFSRDDSGGVWGKNIAQVNLNNGESYDLVVTATNASGSVRKHVVLTWNPETTDSL